MSSDPFNIVKEELRKTINKTKSLLERYNVIVNEPSSTDSSAKLLNEIRTNLRSISWDILDLEETINIASQNPSKFSLTSGDIESRRQFLTQTKEFVSKTKQAYGIDFDDKKSGGGQAANSSTVGSKKVNFNLNSSSGGGSGQINIRIPDIISNATGINRGSGGGGGQYTRLNDNDDSDYEIDTRKALGLNQSPQSQSLQVEHEEIFREQDRNLELISGRVSSLKNISQTMQNELDDQANLLNDLGKEMDTADSRMQNVMKKISKIMHLDNDKRQWTTIFVLVIAIFVVLMLFFIL